MLGRQVCGAAAGRWPKPLGGSLDGPVGAFDQLGAGDYLASFELGLDGGLVGGGVDGDGALVIAELEEVAHGFLDDSNELVGSFGVTGGKLDLDLEAFA